MASRMKILGKVSNDRFTNMVYIGKGYTIADLRRDLTPWWIRLLRIILN